VTIKEEATFFSLMLVLSSSSHSLVSNYNRDDFKSRLCNLVMYTIGFTCAKKEYFGIQTFFFFLLSSSSHSLVSNHIRDAFKSRLGNFVKIHKRSLFTCAHKVIFRRDKLFLLFLLSFPGEQLLQRQLLNVVVAIL
jgi:hypothetical protein